MRPVSHEEDRSFYATCAHARQDKSTRGAPHPISAGVDVAIVAFDDLGRPILEGYASIIACCSQPHVYLVQFKNEKRKRIRFVNPDWQDQPERSLALLHAFWRSNRIADPQVEDFFPSDSSK